MDVERGMIVPPLVTRPDKRLGLKAIYQQTDLMGFPRAAVCDLLCALKCCLPAKDPDKADYKIEKVGKMGKLLFSFKIIKTQFFLDHSFLYLNLCKIGIM